MSIFTSASMPIGASSWPATPRLRPRRWKNLEGLEQLRFLAEGQVVKVVPLDPVGWDCIELNNPSDVAPIEAILRQRGIE